VVIAEAEQMLFPVGAVRAYPGPDHFTGDILTLEVLLSDFAELSESPVSIALDGGAPVEHPGDWQGNILIVREALDTAGLTGQHELRLTAQNGSLSVDETYTFTVSEPALQPANQSAAAWLVREADCCVIHYISGTAAERDIGSITAVLEQAALDFAARTGVTPETRLEVYLLDRMWGNGAFGGSGQLAITYTDRYYGPGVGEVGLHTLAVHEFTHATHIDQGPDGFFRYNEGLAVYIAGGHYKPEPLRERGAALYALGYYTGSPGWIYPRHEAVYLDGALRVTHIAETFGEEALWAYVDAAAGFDVLDDPERLNAVTEEVLGVTADDLDAQFLAWVQTPAPGDQLEDLRLTLELQGLRRQYQEIYAPPPYSIFGLPAETFTAEWALQAALREPNLLGTIATELMIAAGQNAIFEQRYTKAQALVDALDNTLSTQAFGHPLAADYLAITRALVEAGYIAATIHLSGDTATVLAYDPVTETPPVLEEFGLVRVGGTWQIE
jgi:hypothetical protein